MKLQIFRATRGSRLWYFRIRARNGEIVATGEGYTRQAKVIKTLRKIFADAPALLEQLDYIETKEFD